MNKHLRSLYTVMLLDKISNNITFPVLTFVFFSHVSHLFPADTSYAVRSLWYGLVISLSHFGGLITVPLFSALSDTFGRKKLLFIACISAFIFAVSCIAGILLGSLFLLLLGKLIGGLFTRTDAVAQASVADLSDEHNKVVNMGYLQATIALGACIGPLIGGYFAKRYLFDTLNFSVPYFIAALFSIFAIAATWFFFQESAPKKEAYKNKLSNWLSYLKDKKILKISLFLLLIQLSWSLFYQYIPPLLKVDFHFSPEGVGTYVGLIALWLGLAAFFGIKWLKKHFSLRQMSTISIVMMLIGFSLAVAAIILHHHDYATDLIWFSTIPIAMGDVIIYSLITALYSEAVSKGDQGIIMGLCFIIVEIAWCATGLLGGMLAAIQMALPVIVSFVLIVFVFFYRVLKKVH